MTRPLTHLCLAAACAVLLSGADWLQFRGTNTNGLTAGNPPTSWKDVTWTADLPGRGVSGPIVIGDRVVVTSSGGYRQDRLHVHCFDAQTGKLRWERQFWATGQTLCHPKTCVAAPTPASDGKRIFALYASNDLVCLDLDGNLLWYRGLTHDFPNASNSLGMASSPIVVGNTLIVQVESDAEAFATGLDVQNGLHRWKIVRPQRATWTSPTVLHGRSPEKDQVLLQSSKGVVAVHPATGAPAWSYTEGAATIPSCVVSAGIVYVPSHGLTVLRPIAASESPELLWRKRRLAPATSSPLVYEDRVFTINGAGVVKCADAKTGTLAWQLRLHGPFGATPVAAGGHLYFFNEKGLAQVVKPGTKKGEIVSRYDFGEVILCTPAISSGALYVRSDRHLWKVGK